MPSISNLTPGQAPAGSASFTLTVNGSGFASGAVINWGASLLTTAFVNAGQVTGIVPVGLIQQAGIVAVTVSSGGISAPTQFTVSAPSTWSQPNAIDLTTVADIKSYIYPSSQAGTGTDNTILQMLITAFSKYVMWRTKRTTFNGVQQLTQRYDGNGQDKLYLRETPISAVSQVQIWGTNIQQTPDFLQPGWGIDQSGESIVLIGGPGVPLPSNSRYSWTYRYANTYLVFPRGRQNVLVSYSGGYATPPYDLQEACWQVIAQNYRRRGWIDEASKMIPQGGTQTYRNWEIPPQAERVISSYVNRYIF